MPPPLRSVAATIGVLGALLLLGCGVPPTDPAASTRTPAAHAALAVGTCWSGATLGADPQRVLRLSRTYAVTYVQAAAALAQRPAFTLPEGCGQPHHVEVHRVVAVDRVTPVVTDYAELLRPDQGTYRLVDAALRRACTGSTLARAASRTGLPGVVATPVLPDGVELGWAPPSPEQWSRGQRVYACTLTATSPVDFRYATVFTRELPLADRTCIDSASLTFLGCARKHDREQIAVLDLRVAVAAGRVPGRTAVVTGPEGRVVRLAPATLAVLDRACTTYLTAISRTRTLTGVAETDADRWPAADGSYPAVCEADVPPGRRPLVTTGSVYDR